MDLGQLGQFALVVSLVSLCPGPSVLLVVSQQLHYGSTSMIATIAGDLVANLGQMAVVGVGLSYVVTIRVSLTILEWAGVAMLFGLGLARLRRRPIPRGEARVHASLPTSVAFCRGFLVSAANPKALMFFSGMFPAFLSTSRPIVGQLVILAGTFLFIDGLCLLGYGQISHRLGNWLEGRSDHLSPDRFSALLFLLAAFLLLARILCGTNP